MGVQRPHNAVLTAGGHGLRDFGLSKLPQVREAPETAEDLGRPAVSIHGAFTPVMSKPGSFGYGFNEDNYSRPVKLDWTVTAQLWAVGPRGGAFREVDYTRLSAPTAPTSRSYGRFGNVRLSLSQHSARPGQRILSRVENFGSETLSYGEEFSVQRFDAGRWMPAPELVEQEAWFAWLGYLGAGGSGRCSMRRFRSVLRRADTASSST